jgi:hypothetical protein
MSTRRFLLVVLLLNPHLVHVLADTVPKHRFSVCSECNRA